MPARRIAALASPVLSFVDWLFSELAPGMDLFLGLLGVGWLALMIGRPDLFTVGNFRGMEWLPGGNPAWTVFMALTTALHVVGLCRLSWMKVRIASHLLTSWYWLSVAISFARVGLTTGIVAYGLIGVMSLCSAIYISGRPRRFE